jgi:hypothetical protein
MSEPTNSLPSSELRVKVAEKLEGCGDCDPCLGGSPEQCAVGCIAIIEWIECPVCCGVNEGTHDGSHPCPRCDDIGEIPKPASDASRS